MGICWSRFKSCVNRHCDCCYEIKYLDNKVGQANKYCGYPFCPSVYNIKEKSRLTIEFRGNCYCNTHCLNMHKNTNYYSPNVYIDGSPFDYKDYDSL